MAPQGMPRETLDRCATAPLATSARPFALAAVLVLLRSFYDNEGHCFAEGVAFRDSYLLAFFHVEARWVVCVYVAVSSFIPFEFGYVKLVVSSYDYSFVHLGGYDHAIENSSANREGAVKRAVLVIARFFWFLKR